MTHLSHDLTTEPRAPFRRRNMIMGMRGAGRK
jgi:hypothetical protein